MGVFMTSCHIKLLLFLFISSSLHYNFGLSPVKQWEEYDVIEEALWTKNGARKRERNNEYECWMPVPPSIFSYTFIEICMVDNSCFTSLFNTTCTFKSHSLACISTYAARSDVLIRWSCYDKHIWLRGLQSLASSPFWCRTVLWIALRSNSIKN